MRTATTIVTANSRKSLPTIPPKKSIGVPKLELIKTAHALQMGRNGGMARWRLRHTAQNTPAIHLTPDGVLQWWCGVCKGNKSCSALSWKARIISVLEDFEPRLAPLSADRAPMDGCGASVACLEVSARNQGSVRIGIQAYYACFGIAIWLRCSGCSLRLLWLRPGIRISGCSLRCSGLKIDWRRICLRASFFRGRPHRRQRRRPT